MSNCRRTTARSTLIGHENIDRIETNLQIAHAPKSAVRDFRTDYLLKVFRYDRQARVFAEAPMENQIDRARILADDSLKREFRAWLLDPVNLAEFDRGTVLIPEKFLANGAVAPTPVGFDPSDLQPEFGLVQGEGASVQRGDIVAALEEGGGSGVKLQNIRSLGGFERRLNDVTCSGCHQTRGIGGFHFPGVDWMAAKPSNSTVVPASPHFFGDQIRRRDILAALRDGRAPDYSRGFSSRPQLRGSTELAGTEYYDGWGAHCYVQGKQAASNDGSFRDWTCAEGLACQAAGKTSRMGMCFVRKPLKPSVDCARCWQQQAERRSAMSSSDHDKQRNREIAENEADRQTVGDVRVSVWAIAVAVIAGVIVLGIAWAWFNR